MPQITCPNCGTTISLENRKETDFGLISNAARRNPRTFTELLHVTKLSRKTLDLRLKELCREGILVREEGMYKLSGTPGLQSSGPCFGKGLSRVFNDKRLRTGIMLVALLLSFSASGYVLAMFLAPPRQVEEFHQEPVVLGNFTMALDAYNVKDLYSWQAVISFNSSEVKVMNVMPGTFFEIKSPLDIGVGQGIFANATDVWQDGLLLTGSLCGNVTGKDGGGTLGTVVFGYFTSEYQMPRIEQTMRGWSTWLHDSKDATIPIDESTLILK